jgi:hypothetical protein
MLAPTIIVVSFGRLLIGPGVPSPFFPCGNLLQMILSFLIQRSYTSRLKTFECAPHPLHFRNNTTRSQPKIGLFWIDVLANVNTSRGP